MLVHLAAKSLREVMTHKSMIDEIIGILEGSEFTNKLSMLGIPGIILDMIKNTIIHITFFNDRFSGPAT